METTLTQELEALKKELGILQSYASDIGKAREASNATIEASKRLTEALGAFLVGLDSAHKKVLADQATYDAKRSTDWQKVIDEGKRKFDTLATTVKDAFEEIQKSQDGKLSDLKTEHTGLVATSNKLVTDTNDLHTKALALVAKIDGIDFPSQFMKLDATISSINITVGNLHSRLETLERNLKDTYIERSKKSEMLLFIAIGLGVAGIVLGLVF